MNVVVIINNAVFAKFFKYVAQDLKRNGCSVIIVCDSTYTINKFGLNDKEFDIKNFTLYFSEYLKKKEQGGGANTKHSTNQWLCHSDFDRMRYLGFGCNVRAEMFVHYNEALRCFYADIFQENNVNAVFYENVSNALAFAAYENCQTYGVKYLGLTSSRLPGHALFSSVDDDLANNIDRLIKEDYVPATDDESNFIHSYFKNLICIEPDYMKTNGLSKPSFIRKIFTKRDGRTLINAVKYSFGTESNLDVQNGKPLLRSFLAHKRNLLRTIRVRFIDRFYRNDYEGKKYIIYPLHYHPESSTSILANYYDELNLIKNIAFSLPSDVFLLVKDHLSAYGFNDIGFYKTLYSLPNVIIISPETNVKNLIKDSLGVVTLTSTVGYEALMMEKPVVVFGKVFYQNHINVFTAKGYEDISAGIDYLLTYKDKEIADYNTKFLLSYLRLSFKYKLNYQLADCLLINNANKIAAKIMMEISDVKV